MLIMPIPEGRGARCSSPRLLNRRQRYQKDRTNCEALVDLDLEGMMFLKLDEAWQDSEIVAYQSSVEETASDLTVLDLIESQLMMVRNLYQKRPDHSLLAICMSVE